jgi:tetratricopeptide (TPR) repeat protein
LKWNPLAQRLAKARELFRLAEDARKGGRIDEAATHARLACTYDEALKVRAEPILAEADVHKVTLTIKRVNAAMQYGDKSMEAEIKRAAEEAAVVAEQTRRPALLVEVATVLLKVGLAQRAFRLASLASDIDDKLAAAWRIVALAAAAEGKWALAARAAERWLALEPTSADAKAMIKTAKEARGSGKV